MNLLRITMQFCIVTLAALTSKGYAENEVHPSDLSSQVDPMMGNSNYGNTTPSARAPFGMISPGPVSSFHVYGGESSRTGYDANSKEIIAFSLTHLSGVGLHCGGDLPFMPVVGDMLRSPVGHKLANRVTTPKEDKEAYKTKFSDQRAGAGWYQVHLDDSNIAVSLAAAQHSSLVRLDYPKTVQAGIIFCPANDIKGIRDSSLTIDPVHHSISGWVDTGGFSDAPFHPEKVPYRIYFSARFNTPFSRYGVWNGDKRTENQEQIHSTAAAAYLGFDTTQGAPVHMSVAISYVDQAGAVSNLEAEQKDWDVKALRKHTGDAWNELLERFSISGGTDSDHRVWATTLYLNFLHPNVFDDVDGRYTGFDDKIHKMDSGHHFYANFSNWDIYRTTGPLQAMLIPEQAGDMATTLLLAAAQGGGGLPSWSLNNNDTRCMGTYPGTLLLANYIAYGAQGVDLQQAKDRMVDTATRSLPCKQAAGWGDLDNYIRLGWKPGSASETLEFSVTDFAISEMCKKVGDSVNAARFLKRSGSWQNLFNRKPPGIWSKKADGSWFGPLVPQSQKGFTEGCSEQYSWFVPQDTAGLVQKMGSPEVVRKRLEKFFDPFLFGGWHPGDPKYWGGNEPTWTCPYVFNFLKAPWRSQYLVSRIAGTFKDLPGGLPGNDDLGATSASYLFSALGLYPYIPGMAGFVITGPRFPHIKMKIGAGETLEIHALNAGPKNPYIQSLKVNGKPWSRTWIDLADLKTGTGSTLDFVMGPKPNKMWGSGPEDAPPSIKSN